MMSEKKKVDYIYVVDSNGTPLMPTSRLGMVRRWLKTVKQDGSEIVGILSNLLDQLLLILKI